MPKIHIHRSIRIDAPVDRVYQTISDFNHWTAWSPWLIQEPEAKVVIAEDARSYSWEGKRVGSGNMSITGETPGQSIDYDLNFLKPWKSTARVRFELAPVAEGTEATWHMDTGLPFFMFWMKKSMEAFIGMDYERGLALLKDYVEDGEVHSKLDFKGFSDYPGCTFIGIKTSCTKETIGEQMQEDLSTIWHFLQDHQDLIAGPPFSIYHQWHAVNNQIVYTSGVPVNKIPGDLPGGMHSGSIPATRVYTIAHTGPYEHLGNAWTTLYTLHRNKTFKLNKKIDPFEVYLNDPAEAPAHELVTEIHFAVK